MFTAFKNDELPSLLYRRRTRPTHQGQPDTDSAIHGTHVRPVKIAPTECRMFVSQTFPDYLDVNLVRKIRDV